MNLTCKTCLRVEILQAIIFSATDIDLNCEKKSKVKKKVSDWVMELHFSLQNCNRSVCLYHLSGVQSRWESPDHQVMNSVGHCLTKLADHLCSSSPCSIYEHHHISLAEL